MRGSYRGAAVVYLMYLKPFLERNEQAIDIQLQKYEQAATESLYTWGDALKQAILLFLVNTTQNLSSGHSRTSSRVSASSPSQANEPDKGSDASNSLESLEKESPTSAERRKIRRAKREKEKAARKSNELDSLTHAISNALPSVFHTDKSKHSRAASVDPQLGGSNIPPRATRPVQKQSRKKAPLHSYSQTTLNFGQRRLGLSTCPQCRMKFNAALESDQKIHKKYHHSITAGMEWTLKDFASNLKSQGTDIVHVKRPDVHNQKAWKKVGPARFTRKIVEVLEVVNADLGAACQALPDLLDCQVYIALQPNTAKIVGCVVCRPIATAFRVVCDACEPVDTDRSEPLSNVACDNSNPVPAAVGVSRIWVASQHRKCGYAFALLESVRHSFVFGTELPREAIAFSQPTDLGQKLARSYFNRRDYLVYIEK
ncbi:N-acetyltransferase esco2 [Kappamyces sp. JEL0829]|nr:N-acetyltransferase esco2 [Kappamyces sp. JEL0829]